MFALSLTLRARAERIVRPASYRVPQAARGLMLTAGCLVVISGCGSNRPETARVTGVVTLDGQPLAGATVIFTAAGSGGRPARGETDASGRYELTTFDEEPGGGAVLGEQRVTITRIQPNSDRVPLGPDGLPIGGAEPPTVWITPPRYANPGTSGLTAKVVAGTNEFPFDLTSQP